MKRTLTLLGAALLLLPTTTGCGGGSNSSGSNPTPTPSPTGTPKTSAFHVTGVNPTSASASGGTAVTVTGTDFVAPTPGNRPIIYFGNYPALDSVFVNSETITATVPAKVAIQPFTVPIIVCDTSGCTQPNSVIFTYN